MKCQRHSYCKRAENTQKIYNIYMLLFFAIPTVKLQTCDFRMMMTLILLFWILKSTSCFCNIQTEVPLRYTFQPKLNFFLASCFFNEVTLAVFQ